MPNPTGMNRRHFLKHMAGYSLLALPALEFLRTITANAQNLRRNNKSVIILWMGGGPATIDIWDLKPGRKTGGDFRPISTSVPCQRSFIPASTRATPTKQVMCMSWPQACMTPTSRPLRSRACTVLA